jgi:hypothetical protein
MEMGDLHFDGDPETDSTRRRLERVMKEERPRSWWPWKTALLAGGTAFVWWQLNRRKPRKDGDGTNAATTSPRKH